MANVIFGVLLGVLLGFFLGMLGAITFWGASKRTYNHILERVLEITASVVLVVSPIIGGVVGTNMAVHENNSYISQYRITKDTIEQSLKNDAIGGLERVKLVQQAVNENKNLVKMQYDSQQWYGFFIPNEVLELEPIRLGEPNC